MNTGRTTTEKMLIRDKIAQVVHTQHSPGTILSRSEIINDVCNRFPGTNRSSVIPSDFCNNRKNKDPQSGIYPFFRYLQRNSYEVLP